MLDAEIRQLRDDLGESIEAPPFDDLVARSHRRRRGTIVGIAAVGVLAVGIATGAGAVVQQRADSPPVSHPNDPVGIRSADEILDSADARLFGYQTGGGREVAEWNETCDENSCVSALAWSDDGWATRQSRLLPTYADFALVPDGILLYSDSNQPDYVLTDDGAKVRVTEPAGERPLGDTEIVVYRRLEPRFVALDPATGRTHRIPGIEGVTPQSVDRLLDGELRMYGSLQDGSMVYAASTDGGRNWSQHSVPATQADAIVLGTATNVFVFKQGIDGPEVIVSSDGGTTWDRVDDVPFGTVGCLQPTDDGRLLVTNGSHLYASTDATWRTFAEDESAPDVSCLGTSGFVQGRPGAVTTVASDQTGAYASTDNGRTWTEVDPR